jgi:hypothetical protein
LNGKKIDLKKCKTLRDFSVIKKASLISTDERIFLMVIRVTFQPKTAAIADKGIVPLW